MNNENLKIIALIIVGIIEICLRLIPTNKNYSLIANFANLMDKLVPNYAKDDDEEKPPHNLNVAV